VMTPSGRGVVKSYEVMKDALVVEFEGSNVAEVKVDDAAEIAP
jgi:hypothetical protein